MYQAYFGLERTLFEAGIAREEAVFLGPRQQLVVANFKVALTTFDSAIVLTGAAGLGKTTITSAAVRTTTRLALGWLTGPPTHGAETLELLLAEFGFSPHRIGRVERLQIWRQFLNETNATGSRVLVVAERAEEMDTEVLRTLDAVTAADPSGCPGANLLLLGQPELGDRLALPALASLRQRIRLRQRLEPFTAEELEAYLRHRVSVAGGDFERIFDPAAVGALHRYSAGVPRVVNNLCETALTLAASGAEQRLTSQLIVRVAVGLFGIEPADATATAAAASDSEKLAGSAGAMTDELPVLTDAIDPPPSAGATANTSAPATQQRDRHSHSDSRTPVKEPGRDAAADRDSSMAEALFGDADLEMLSVALASAGWTDDDDTDDLLKSLVHSAKDDPTPIETPKEADAPHAAADADVPQVATPAAPRSRARRKAASTR